MKILQVNCVYKKGSTGKITYDLHQGLIDSEVDSVVCYGRGEIYNESNVIKTCPEWYSKLNNVWSRITGIMYGGLFFSTIKLIAVIKKEKPDIVHLQCINGYFVNVYNLITWLKKNHIKTVLTLHAEFMHTANCGNSFECEKWKTGCGACPHYREVTKSMLFDRTAESWKKMKRAFEGFNDNLIVTSVSPWLMERAKCSPILERMRHGVVLNGLDTTLFHQYENRRDLRKKIGIDEVSRIVFHATPWFNSDPKHIKGGYYVIELAKRLPKVQFVVAGSYPSELKVPKNVLLLGRVEEQACLAQLYSMSDLTVLTSKKETFSMVTAESLCCGTPVVGFKAGAPEIIALKEYSWFVDYGDIEALAETVNKFLSTEFDYLQMKKSVVIYSKESMVDNYMKVYQELAEV
jgi:glycosyltransferase involved in cell wall biosynthesis